MTTVSTPGWLQVVFSLFLLIACRAPESDKMHLLSLEGKASMVNWSGNMMSYVLAADSGGYTAMPVRGGDLIYVNLPKTEIFFRYRPSFPDTLHFEVKDTLVYLNDQLRVVEVNAEHDLLPWFKELTPEVGKGIWSLMIFDSLPQKYRPGMARLANFNPGVDLFFIREADSLRSEDLLWLSKHFRPAAFYLDLHSSELGMLQKFPSLNLLSLNLIDSAVSEPLPSLSALKELHIRRYEGKLVLPVDFLKNNPQLEKISFCGEVDTRFIDFSGIRHLRSLKLIDENATRFAAYGKRLPELESFSLVAKAGAGFSQFSGFRQLRELAVPGSLTQADFEQVISSQPDLEYLQVLVSDTLLIQDFSVLQKEKKLKYLLISKKSGKAMGVHRLKNLDYLSLPKDFFEDSLQVTALKKALPNTVIVPNSGACMGSAWLLLLIPLALIMVVMSRWLSVKPASDAS